jgi:ATP-binding cassette subfamily C protein
MEIAILNAKTAYHIISGTINLYLVKQSKPAELAHQRHYLGSAAAGETIYGGKAEVEGGSYQLIGSGSRDLQMETVACDETPITTQRYLQEKAIAIEVEIQKQQKQFRAENDRRIGLLNKAVSDLTNQVPVSPPRTGSLYFRICQAAATALGLQIEEPKLVTAESQEAHDLMRTYLEKTNLRYRSIKLTGQWWKKSDGVIIAFKTNQQPVVLIAGHNRRCEMNDLAAGERSAVDEKIAAELKQEAFMLYRTLPENEISGWDLLKFGLKKISRKDLRLFLLCLAGIGLLGMAVPLLTGLTVSWIIPEGNLNLLFQIGIILIATSVSSFCFALTRGFVMLRIEGKLDVDLQTAVWDRLLNLPLSFFKNFTSAELASRALGITLIRDIVSGPVMVILLTSIYALFCWLVLFYYRISLAVVASLMIGVYLTINCIFAKTLIHYESRINQLSNRLAGLSFQLVKGAIKIQKSGAEERAYHRWSEAELQQHRAVQGKGGTTAKIEAFNGLFLPVSLVIIYGLITTQPAFSLPVGAFVGFNSAYMILMTSMFGLFSSLQVIAQVLPLYERGKVILQTKPESRENKRLIEEPTGRIEVDHLRFRYSETGPEILKDVSLQINPGEYVGIVGTSGSGKSTLLKLLLGFETTYRGKITYDHQDIRTLDLRELRKRIGVVLQTGKLMTDNIYHNIVGTNLRLSQEEAWKAAEIAGIDEDIRAMPMGMHTMLMEGAGTISGGQKQRILIARAVAGNPRMLFFDEATSALDNITQAKIKQALDGFSATRIVIAHRLSTVKHCDRIIVLDHGEIKETGDYETLIKKQGLFYDLVKRQVV